MKSFKIITITLLLFSFYFIYDYVIESNPQKEEIHKADIEILNENHIKPNTELSLVNVTKPKEEVQYTHNELGNNEISPFPIELSIIGMNSLHPKKAIDVYINNIEQAKDGNHKSQYLVARSLMECYGVASNNDLEKYSQQNTVPEDKLQQLKAHTERCESFSDYYSQDELNDWNTHYNWMLKAKNNGNAIAKSWHFQTHPEQYNQEQAYQIVMESISSREPEDFFSYSSIQDYLVNYIPDSDNDSSAIELTRCRVVSWCDEKIKEAYIEHYESHYDANLIKEKSEAYVDFIKNNNLDEIRNIITSK